MDYVQITPDKISIDRVTDLVASPVCGGIAVFIGTARDNFDGRRVVRLEYEAYESMAEAEIRKICQLIRNQWPVENIAIEHRIGVVPVCEASIVVAVSSAHRRECQDAVRYAIDALKTSVPIWKKEIYEDETFSWKENKECVWKS